MKVHLWAMGASSDAWVSQGEELYKKRIERYLPFEYKCIQASKSNQQNLVLADESKWLLQQCEATPTKLILLDEKGPQLTSVHFSKRFENWRQGSHKRLVFVIGSAYGFDPKVYDRADELLGLSAMTLPHQLCRLMMLEQLYRACTILRGESYHHT
ncbi:MAG: 23S rRNA (pseudouridine(1915)-N(3))-methyltransferase RlmH [Saprospiraceae bacterium]|nr:23S rRNA (pseudouridine(1915)-N(3))-methyltransferase RlmH [Candidatus Opimibacter skivensis]MBL0005898.1 23S rRNA (pseudouridine(1915)-N(3))-methyltransferase RlmH [Candidatus Opimibacter skivensis]